MTTGRGRGVPSILAGMAALQLGLFLYYLWRTAIFGLFYDMADFLLEYARYHQGGSLFAFLLSHYHEHVLAITRLILLADIELFGGVSYPFVAASLACIGLIATLLIGADDRAERSGAAFLATAAVILMLIANAAVAADCSAPVNGVYSHTLAFAALALYLFEGRKETDAPHWMAAKRGLALLTAMLSALDGAAGLLIWPILLWAAWRGRAGLGWTAATVICGAAFIAFYMQGHAGWSGPGLPAPGESFLSTSHLLRMAGYIATYMGLPWSHDPRLLVPAEIFGGALFLVCCGLALRRGLLAPSGGRLERVGIGLVVFVLGTALLAALRRGDVSISGGIEVPVRYTIFLSVLHAALAALAGPWIARTWPSLRAGRRLQAGALAFGGLLLAQQIAIGQAAVLKANRINAVIARFMAGHRDPGMEYIVHLDGGTADRALAFMRSARIYDFRQ